MATILVVDDDDEVREMLADTLDDLGYAVRQATSGEAALGLLDNGDSVDMIITDIRMPGMSGLELAEQVGQRCNAVKVILISGYFQSHSQPITRRFLRKPFRIQELASAVAAELA